MQELKLKGVEAAQQVGLHVVDMLEATVRRRLLGGDADDNARLFRQVAVGILHVESVSQRVADRT